MQLLDNNTQAFLALVRAGLWEQDVHLSKFESIDYSRVLSLAEEQSVVGLVAAGLEHVIDVKVPKEDVLQFVGHTLQLEQQNQAMNQFIELLIQKMRDQSIYAILVKGQGIAQCYKKPLWRACGDIDFLLSNENYFKAKAFLTPRASIVNPDRVYDKHLNMTIDPWVIELHGNLHCGLSSKIDKVIDGVIGDVFFGGNVRSWMDGKTQVFLPGVDNDIILVFTHILQHFFKEGIGLRQICDWCRLIYTYRETLNYSLLELRIKNAGLMSEWKAFATLAVDYLGMSSEIMPFYSVDGKWRRKAENIRNFILEVGNFGHNTDTSYYCNYPYLIRKAISSSRRVSILCRHAKVFPLDSLRFLLFTIFNGLRSAFRGE